VILTGSLNCELTSVITARIDSSLANMSSCDVASPPIMLDILTRLLEIVQDKADVGLPG
jgi:hypothetical protein